MECVIIEYIIILFYNEVYTQDFYTDLQYQCSYNCSYYQQTCHFHTHQSIFQISLRNDSGFDFHQSQLLLSYVDSNARSQTLKLSSKPTQNM